MLEQILNHYHAHRIDRFEEDQQQRIEQANQSLD